MAVFFLFVVSHVAASCTHAHKRCSTMPPVTTCSCSMFIIVWHCVAPKLTLPLANQPMPLFTTNECFPGCCASHGDMPCQGQCGHTGRLVFICCQTLFQLQQTSTMTTVNKEEGFMNAWPYWWFWRDGWSFKNDNTSPHSLVCWWSKISVLPLWYYWYCTLHMQQNIFLPKVHFTGQVKSAQMEVVIVCSRNGIF